MDITNATGEDVAYKVEETERTAEREFCAADARLIAEARQPWPECGRGLFGHDEDCSRRASPEPPPGPAPTAYDAQVEAIVRGFLIPACQYRPAEGEPYDPHAPWKLVAFVGGVIAGRVSSFDPELVDRTHLAQRMTDDCGGRLLDLLAPTDTPDDGFAFARKVAGSNGLVKRTAEALLRLGVER